MPTIKVKLSKLNNQTGQYEHSCTTDVDSDTYKKWAENPGRCPVPGFYKYEGEIDGVMYTIESVSPALFDHPKIHMT